MTLHNNEGSYLAHTQGKKHQANLARRAAKEAKESPQQVCTLIQNAALLVYKMAIKSGSYPIDFFFSVLTSVDTCIFLQSFSSSSSLPIHPMWCHLYYVFTYIYSLLDWQRHLWKLKHISLSFRMLFCFICAFFPETCSVFW